MNEQGEPVRLINATKTETVDSTPIELDRIQCGGRSLIARPSLRFEPDLDEETHDLYVVTDESLDLHVFAHTRDELAEELIRHIFFVWDAYAKEPPDRMTAAAQRLRETYLRRFEEAVHATE